MAQQRPSNTTKQSLLSEDELPDQRVAVLMPLMDVIRELQVDPASVLQDSGLPADALKDPEKRISFASTGKLIATAAHRTGCDHIGLLAGQRLRLQHMGMLGQLALRARTVGDALTALCVHQHLHSRGVVLFMFTEGDRCTLGFPTYHPAVLGVEHFSDGAACMVMNCVRDLTAPDWRPDEVHLARSEPRSVSPYRRAFPCRITFDSEINALCFAASVLERRIPTADPDIYRTLEASIADAGRHSLVNDLRRALRVTLTRGDTSGDRVAQMLQMHFRTLNRRLQEVGTTFQAVLDDVRFTTARHHLTLTRMPLVQIAAALGYSEVSAFTRAFRRWSGMTPGEFRRTRAETTSQTDARHG